MVVYGGVGAVWLFGAVFGVVVLVDECVDCWVCGCDVVGQCGAHTWSTSGARLFAWQNWDSYEHHIV